MLKTTWKKHKQNTRFAKNKRNQWQGISKRSLKQLNATEKLSNRLEGRNSSLKPIYLYSWQLSSIRQLKSLQPLTNCQMPTYWLHHNKSKTHQFNQHFSPLKILRIMSSMIRFSQLMSLGKKLQTSSRYFCIYLERAKPKTEEKVGKTKEEMTLIILFSL